MAISDKSFEEALEELIDEHLEGGETTRDEVISALELKLAAFREEDAA